MTKLKEYFSRRSSENFDPRGVVGEKIKELFEFRGHVEISYEEICNIGDFHGEEDGDIYALELAQNLANKYGWVNDDQNEKFIKVYKP